MQGFKLIIVLLLSRIALGQESVNTSGSDATGSNGTVAYSIGQVVFTTNNSNSGTVSQGVQQAYEIFTVGNKETELTISLSVFPNPTADNLILQVDDFGSSSLKFQLYDSKGKLFNMGEVKDKQTQISASSLPPAIYFIDVLDQENKKVQTFKIIKN